ncbi:sensor histidine kinase [Neobacillus drentensis]|uniref:sensor histidine kinase n=1 Tax=Neobacillus drentensis TaxID=220684 RepID=UPI001F42EAA1|nr:sensor histidine kinase [Neobacillus drentensis]ULT54868.1 sensor histidine kinase [Neobacillus drentensis]
MSKFHTYKDFTIFNITDGFLISKIVNIFWIILIYSGALILQYLKGVLVIQSAVTTTLIIAIYIFIYWFSDSLTKKRSWLYFFVQGSLIFVSSFLVPKGSPVILVGLLPLLVAQSIIIFQNNIKILIVFTAAYCFYGTAIWLNYGLHELPIYILIFFINVTIVNFYSVIYNRQVHARLRMESYLHELEKAHQKVEQLTLANERQRMARDLHDTLAQGLAGLIMQLEAVDAHLKNGNMNRSEEIIQKSMIRARETLKNARTAIDNLREMAIEETDLYREALKQIKGFTDATSIHVNYEIGQVQKLSTFKMEHCLYILSESLANVAKHAQAEKVRIVIKKINHQLRMEIEDDGIGFKENTIGNNLGKYGLLGLYERVRLINGEIDIKSMPGRGTKIKVTVPI